jgi:hypothetical protein
MLKRGKKHDNRPSFDVIVEGAGISLGDVSIRELANLLSAAHSLLEAVAKELGHEVPTVALGEVRSGSACYRLFSGREEQDEPFGEIAARAYTDAKERGKKSSPSIRGALNRLHRSSEKGSIAIQPRNIRRSDQVEKILIAAPLELTEEYVNGVTQLYGRIVGVEALKNRLQLTLKLEEGGKTELETEETIAEHAGRLFNKKVSIKAKVRWSADGLSKNWEAISIHQWNDSDLLEIMTGVRQELREEGIRIDPERWLQSTREED